MSEPFLGEISVFAGNFAPRGWAFCNGQLLPIAQNSALFSILGTTYGGDGRTTFALPDLRGRAPMHPGNGPGLTSRRLGQRGGADSVTLNQTHMPNHQHSIAVSDATGDTDTPSAGAHLANASQVAGRDVGGFTGTANTSMAALSDYAGGGRAHNNLQPLLAVHYIIALQGIFPSRN